MAPSVEYGEDKEHFATPTSPLSPVENSIRGDETTDAEQAALPQQPDLSQPPDGGYGWVCVVCSFLINAHTWGLNSSYGVFLSHYLEFSTFPGATYFQYAFVGGLSISQALLLSPLATTITRLYGTRTTLLIGVFFETLALVGASFSTQIWHLFLSQGICFGWGMGFQFVGSVGVISQWFLKRRSIANGIAASGSGFGGLVYSLATGAIIQKLGLAWTFRILALVQFPVNFMCAILLKDRNKHVNPTQRAFDYRLFKRYEFLLFLGWGVFSMLGYIVLLFSLPNYARSIGLSAKQGSVVGAVMNLGQGLGRPLVGHFSDAAGRINIAGFLTFFCGFICFVIWIFAKTYGLLLFFAILVGTVCGVFWNTVAPIGAEVVGLVDLPSGLSIMWLILVVPTTFSEPIGLQLRQASGNIYLHAQIYAGCMYVAAALCMWFLRGWKIAELADKEAEKRFATDTPTTSTSGHSNASVIKPVKLEEPPPSEDAGGSRKHAGVVLRRMVMWSRV